jgi:H+/gluconate symporter-like permease
MIYHISFFGKFDIAIAVMVGTPVVIFLAYRLYKWLKKQFKKE